MLPGSLLRPSIVQHRFKKDLTRDPTLENYPCDFWGLLLPRGSIDATIMELDTKRPSLIWFWGA